jgi:hypothetical protein
MSLTQELTEKEVDDLLDACTVDDGSSGSGNIRNISGITGSYYTGRQMTLQHWEQ